MRDETLDAISKTCRVPKPGTGDACGKDATHVVVFTDDSRASVCHPCGLRLDREAQARGTRIRLERVS
jgi:hypothetical protein